jgi:hypothetical protein
LYLYKKVNINIGDKFTILHKAVAWAVVRGLFLFLEYIFFFISIVGPSFTGVSEDVWNIQMVSCRMSNRYFGRVGNQQPKLYTNSCSVYAEVQLSSEMLTSTGVATLKTTGCVTNQIQVHVTNGRFQSRSSCRLPFFTVWFKLQRYICYE